MAEDAFRTQDFIMAALYEDSVHARKRERDSPRISAERSAGDIADTA